MRHPSKHCFFSRFLVPDQRYSDSAGGIFWTANRSTKTQTFQNGSKRATWKTHAKSQHTAEFGKKTARIRGRLVHKSWSFEKLCQVREIVPNRNKTLRFFARKKWTEVMRARRCGRFFAGAPKPQNDDQKWTEKMHPAIANRMQLRQFWKFDAFHSFRFVRSFSLRFISSRFVSSGDRPALYTLTPDRPPLRPVLVFWFTNNFENIENLNVLIVILVPRFS